MGDRTGGRAVPGRARARCGRRRLRRNRAGRPHPRGQGKRPNRHRRPVGAAVGYGRAVAGVAAASRRGGRRRVRTGADQDRRGDRARARGDAHRGSRLRAAPGDRAARGERGRACRRDPLVHQIPRRGRQFPHAVRKPAQSRGAALVRPAARSRRHHRGRDHPELSRAAGAESAAPSCSGRPPRCLRASIRWSSRR